LYYKEIKIFKKFDFYSYPPAHLRDFQSRILVRIAYVVYRMSLEEFISRENAQKVTEICKNARFLGRNEQK